MSRRNPRVSLALVLAAALALAAHALSASPNVKSMVLQRSDIPQGFTVRQTGSFDKPKAISSYVTVYVNAHGSFIDLVRIDSSASLFSSRADALVALNSLVRQIKGSNGKNRIYEVKELTGAKVGVVTRWFRVRYYAGSANTESHTIVWIDGPVESVVNAIGSTGTVNPGQILALAKKQETRVARVRASG